MMTATEARTAILASRCCIVYFTKRDGTTRRMVCHVPAETDPRAFTRTPEMLSVWDVEKGAIRTVNLATVHQVRPVATRPHVRTAPRRSLDSIAALFDNGAPRKGQRLGFPAC